jgi:hypothetical protein
MKDIIIYGAGDNGIERYYNLRGTHNVIGFADRDPALIGTKINGIPVFSPENIPELLNISSEKVGGIYISSITNVYPIREYLIDKLKVPVSLIDSAWAEENRYVAVRFVWFETQVEFWRKQDISGAFAECGVFRGYFARIMNRLCPERKLYLFDTFGSFAESDLKADIETGAIPAERKEGLLATFTHTSAEAVVSSLPHPERVIVRKGFFPETTKPEIADEFCFVDLDFDLYTPILAGLRYFWPKMVSGGVILVHDYFWQDDYLGPSRAVHEFAAESGVKFHAIGDKMSAVFIKD